MESGAASERRGEHPSGHQSALAVVSADVDFSRCFRVRLLPERHAERTSHHPWSHPIRCVRADCDYSSLEEAGWHERHPSGVLLDPAFSIPARMHHLGVDSRYLHEVKKSPSSHYSQFGPALRAGPLG